MGAKLVLACGPKDLERLKRKRNSAATISPEGSLEYSHCRDADAGLPEFCPAGGKGTSLLPKSKFQWATTGLSMSTKSSTST